MNRPYHKWQSDDIANRTYSTNDDGPPDGADHPEASFPPFPIRSCWEDLNAQTMKQDEPPVGRFFAWIVTIFAAALLLLWGMVR